jgi:polyvinyl alcohol dehydrogenase (cytochrome)
MFEEIRSRTTVKSWLGVHRAALPLALLVAFAGVSRTSALNDRDHEQEQERNNRGEENPRRNDRDDQEENRHQHEARWRMIGRNSKNSRNQPFEHSIRKTNVGRLAVKWTASTTGDVSATPAVVHGAVYFGDFGGTLWKLDAETGHVIWSHKVADYTGNAGDYARTSPALADRTLVVGIIKGSTTVAGPNMLGIDEATGTLRWKTQIHPDPHAAMTGSPALVGNTIVTGVSANGASNPATATFRGAIVALNAQTGAILWRTYSLPDNGGVPGRYAGATMFAPPAIDKAAGLVYGTFGQAYSEPASVTACHTLNGGFTESCEQPGSFLRSIVAFDLRTGAPRWSYRVIGHDPWERACGSQPVTVTWCAPQSDGEKWDMGGSGPNVMRIRNRGHWYDVVGFGGKSGVYVLLDAKTGKFVWNTLVGPGGDQGGMEWGTAFDGRRIYVSITNQHHIPYELTEHGVLSSTTATGGSWAALDPETGKILWQAADPGLVTLTSGALTGTFGSWALAPVSSANDILYASSMAYQAATADQMYALDAKTGEILWRFTAGTSVNAGPAIVDGVVYWGSGYTRAAEGGPNPSPKLYAFSIDGR